MAIKEEDNAEKLDHSLKLIAKTSFIVLVGLFLSKLLTYIYRIVVARYFGPEAYGLFSLATMVLSLFIAVSSLGLTEGILRFLPIYRGKEQTKKINYLLRFSLAILFVSGIISGLILFFLSNFLASTVFHDANLIIYFKIFGLLIPFSILCNVFLYILRAYEKVSWYSFLQNIFQPTLKLIFLVLFFWLGFSANSSIILSYSMVVILMLIAAYYLCRNLYPHFLSKSLLKNNEKSEIKKSLFSYSWPLIFLAVIGNLFYWTDSFAIGFFRSVEEVGFYNAAVPIAALLLFLSEVFGQLFYPLITREYSNKNFKLVKELSKQVGKWMFIINLPALLVMLIFPGVLINFLFGAKYLIAENSLRLLALSVFVSSISSISTTILSMVGRSKLLLSNIVFFSVLNLVLDIFLVPVYGIDGAAFATLVSVALSGFVFMYWAYKYTSIIPLRRKMLGITIINAVLFIPLLILSRVMFVTPIELIILGIIFIIIYFSLIYLTKCFDKNDMSILLSIRKKIFNK